MPASTYLIAHRGLSAHYPENSMAAFAEALPHCKVLEVDVRATNDGVLVCHHDRTLERTHDFTSHIGQMEWKDLANLTPGVPRLEDVLEAFGADRGFVLDVKISRPRMIDKLVKTVDQFNISWDTARYLRSGKPIPPGYAVFESRQPELLQSFRSRTGAGCLELVSSSASERELLVTAPLITAYAQGVVIPDAFVSRSLLKVLRLCRLGSYVYTVNDQGRLDTLREMGVTAVFTDDVKKLS